MTKTAGVVDVDWYREAGEGRSVGREKRFRVLLMMLPGLCNCPCGKMSASSICQEEPLLINLYLPSLSALQADLASINNRSRGSVPLLQLVK
jgi:hypothetical protein